jgi:isoamylase
MYNTIMAGPGSDPAPKRLIVEPHPVKIGTGVPLPLGTHTCGDGTNVAIFSRHATGVSLLLFKDPHDSTPTVTFDLDPGEHRTGDIWHVWIGGVGVGWGYAFRVDGPYRPEEGHRFNRHKVLLDPYATALGRTALWDFSRASGFDARSPAADLSFSTDDNVEWMARCVLTDDPFDWQGDRPLRHAWPDTVVYETHVRGLTIHPSSGAAHPGTFLGVVDMIPYFQDLGITTVELMPVQEFNERERERRNPLTGEALRNYWGYNPVAFFAPKESYGSGLSPGCQVSEFKTMVRELHRAGIEVILDMVFNHTAEGDERGPTLNFRGLGNRIYYLLDTNRRYYRDYSGCGNSINCNHPIVREYLLDCLRHWVVQMHVDGFRFDLASALERGRHGALLPNPPLLERIAEDPILKDVKLIAEAWDAAGVYQVGAFPAERWSEWNGRYRDDIRRFWRGDPGMVGALASRLCGSPDLYQRGGREPVNSINFVTCHDGFTLNDLVSYCRKHNEANGEGDRDGPPESYSDNYGIEGATPDPAIEATRGRQILNMLGTLLVSRGVPMVLGGDEFRRTQWGNNNAYCQDNETSWYDWTFLQSHQEVFAFVRDMLRFRKRHRVLREDAFYTEEEIQWFNPAGHIPLWGGPDQTLGCRILARGGESSGPYALCLLFNAGVSDVDFQLPPAPRGQRWSIAVNTTQPPYVHEPGQEMMLTQRGGYVMRGRSFGVLISR